MVPSELWLPPCFSIPQEIHDENLIEFLLDLHLSSKEQFSGTVKKTSINNLKKKKSSLSHGGGISKLNPLLNQQQVADKTVADCVEALIGMYLQVCIKFTIQLAFYVS